MENQISKSNLIKLVKEIKSQHSINKSLIKEDRALVENIMLSENILDKVKEYAKKGLLSAAIVSSLLASPNVSAAEKAEIKKMGDMSTKMATSFPKEITLPNIQGQGSSIQGDNARYIALKQLRSTAKQEIYQKYNIDPNKYEVKINNITLSGDKTAHNQNNGEYNSNVSGTVVLSVVPRDKSAAF